MPILGLNTIKNFLRRGIVALGTKEILSKLLMPLGVVFSWLYVMYIRTFVPVALWIAQQVTRMYFIDTKEWAPFISEYMNRFTGGRITVEDITREGLGYGSRSAMEALGKKFLTPMLGLIMPQPPLTMDKALGGANRFLATNLSFQMSAWLLHFIGDAVSLGKFKSLKDLPNAISWSYGIGWLSWLVMGTPFRKGIADPLERLYNRIYTYTLPTIAQARDAVRHGIFTMEDYLNICLDLGYSPENAAMLYTTTQKDLSDSDIRKFLQLGWIERSEATEEFVRRGYEPGRAEILARLESDRRKLDVIDDIIKEVEDLFLERVLDEQELLNYYQQAGYSEVEIRLKRGLLDLRKGRRRFLTAAQVWQAHDKKIISFAEARDYLVDKIQYTTEDADIYLKIREGAK